MTKPKKRPEGTNTASWIDAEDPLWTTLGDLGSVLEMAIEMHRHRTDDGQIVMLKKAAALIEQVYQELIEDKP